MPKHPTPAPGCACDVHTANQVSVPLVNCPLHFSLLIISCQIILLVHGRGREKETMHLHCHDCQFAQVWLQSSKSVCIFCKDIGSCILCGLVLQHAAPVPGCACDHRIWAASITQAKQSLLARAPAADAASTCRPSKFDISFAVCLLAIASSWKMRCWPPCACRQLLPDCERMLKQLGLKLATFTDDS